MICGSTNSPPFGSRTNRSIVLFDRAGVARRGLDRLYREEWCRGLDRLPEQSSIRGRRWIDNHCNALCRKQVSCPGYVAHELSGFIASVWEALEVEPAAFEASAEARQNFTVSRR